MLGSIIPLILLVHVNVVAGISLVSVKFSASCHVLSIVS